MNIITLILFIIFVAAIMVILRLLRRENEPVNAMEEEPAPNPGDAYGWADAPVYVPAAEPAPVSMPAAYAPVYPSAPERAPAAPIREQTASFRQESAAPQPDVFYVGQKAAGIWKCANCGTENPDGETVCSLCGAPK